MYNKENIHYFSFHVKTKVLHSVSQVVQGSSHTSEGAGAEKNKMEAWAHPPLLATRRVYKSTLGIVGSSEGRGQSSSVPLRIPGSSDWPGDS